MRAMERLWSIFSALLLFLQTCTGDTSCVIWSSAGRTVQRTSPFRVYCTFHFKCDYSMYSGHPPIQEVPQHDPHNITTVYLKVDNLKEDRTYSCDCKGPRNTFDSCGLDIAAGYRPEQPTNLSCVYKVVDSHHSSAVVCSWASGRETHLTNNSRLWVKTFTHNAMVGSEPYSVSAKGRSSLSAEITVDSSVQVISVWAHITNDLGSAVSPALNYTLSDIMMPPAPILQQVECSSRNCSIKVNQSVTTHHLDINYKDNNDDKWTPYPESVVAFGSVLVPSLEPYRLYDFRARSRFTTGLWSEWSSNISNWTQEEAPATALDVWYAVDHGERSMRVFWKKPGISVARGKILEYIITLSHNSTETFNANSDEQSQPVPFCSKCVVTVCARNSRGLSPPASVPTLNTKENHPLVPVINNQRVTINWGKSANVPLPVEFVVEWYPRGQKLQRLRWARMGGNSSHIVITDMTPFVCYEGAVYVFYKDKSVDRHAFTGISTNVSVPTAGPDVVEDRVEGNTVTVTWSELHVSQRGGCITLYTIYLESSLGHVTSYNVSSSQRFWILSELDPAVYNIWMTASTAKGEGRPGQKVKVYIQLDVQLPLLLVCAVLVLMLLFFIWACNSSAVKQKLWVYLQCFMLDVIPDPANSKWVKECLEEKDKTSLQLQLSISSTATEEEHLVLTDIQELPRPLLCPQTSCNSDSETSSPVYPPTTYIKSFSHDSDSSCDTQTSLDTNGTGGYISSHTTMFEEEPENNEDRFSFLSSPSISMEPLHLGSKLTLDGVRIDGVRFLSSVVDVA